MHTDSDWLKGLRASLLSRLSAPMLLVLVDALLYVMPIEDMAWLVAARIVVAYLFVGLLPGLLIIRLFADGHLRGFYEIISFAALISIIIVQTLCIAALLLHLSMRVTATALLILVMIGLFFDASRLNRAPIDWMITCCSKGGLAAILFVAVLLYLEGGISTLVLGLDKASLPDEDILHIGIAQRLNVTPAPTIHNTFLYPDFVYTYPFPGMHYFYALVAQVGNFDDLMFVYDKGRFFWWLLSVSFCSCLALRISGRKEIADALPIVFALLVLTGGLARISGLFVGQVAPMSHVAVVAGDVLLPGTLLAAMTVILSEKHAITGLLTIIALAMAAVLILVHPREVVQLLVYLSALTLGLAMLRARQQLMRGVVMTAVVFGMLVAYRSWHSDAVPALKAVMIAGQSNFEANIADLSWVRLFGPLDHSKGIDTLTYYGIYGIVFLTTPLLIWANRDKPGSLMIGLSMTFFLMISYVGWLSIPFIRLTSFEMLSTPTRNWWLFSRILLVILIIDLGRLIAQRLDGASLHDALAGFGSAGLIAQNRTGPWSGAATLWAARLAELAAFLAAVGGLAHWLPSSTDIVRNAIIIIMIIVLPAASLAIMLTDPTQHHLAPTLSARHHCITTIFIAILLAVASFMPMCGPLARMRDWPQLLTPQRLARQAYKTGWEGLKRLGEADGSRVDGQCLVGTQRILQSPYAPAGAEIFSNPRACLPPYALVEWMQKSLPPLSVVWVDLFGVFSPQPFVNVQLALPPLGRSGFLIYPHLQFPAATSAVARIRAKGGQQPILDGIEDDVELLAHLKEFKVTHIVVDPAHSSVLSRFISLGYLTRVYSIDEWSVYSVETSLL